MAARAEDHHDFDRLAVDHVVGGLSPSDQARFRDHLAACDACRARVTELRGIASDLQRTAESASPVLTRVSARAPARAVLTGRKRVIRLVVAALAGLVVGGLAFWNFQLRLVNSVVDTANQTNRQALATLAEGALLLTVDFTEGVRGLVAQDDEHVVFDLTGLPELPAGEFVVLWAEGGEQPRSALVTVAASSIDDDGRLVLVARRPVEAAVLTVEVGPFDARPARAVVTADVAPAPGGP